MYQGEKILLGLRYDLILLIYRVVRNDVTAVSDHPNQRVSYL
jgi:hypothetical protein